MLHFALMPYGAHITRPAMGLDRNKLVAPFGRVHAFVGSGACSGWQLALHNKIGGEEAAAASRNTSLKIVTFIRSWRTGWWLCCRGKSAFSQTQMPEEGPHISSPTKHPITRMLHSPYTAANIVGGESSLAGAYGSEKKAVVITQPCVASSSTYDPLTSVVVDGKGHPHRSASTCLEAGPISGGGDVHVVYGNHGVYQEEIRGVSASFPFEVVKADDKGSELAAGRDVGQLEGAMTPLPAEAIPEPRGGIAGATAATASTAASAIACETSSVKDSLKPLPPTVAIHPEVPSLKYPKTPPAPQVDTTTTTTSTTLTTMASATAMLITSHLPASSLQSTLITHERTHVSEMHSVMVTANMNNDTTAVVSCNNNASPRNTPPSGSNRDGDGGCVSVRSGISTRHVLPELLRDCGSSGLGDGLQVITDLPDIAWYSSDDRTACKSRFGSTTASPALSRISLSTAYRPMGPHMMQHPNHRPGVMTAVTLGEPGSPADSLYTSPISGYGTQYMSYAQHPMLAMQVGLCSLFNLIALRVYVRVGQHFTFRI